MSEPETRPSDSNLAFVEGLYRDFLRDPESVASDWRAYFEQFAGVGPQDISAGRGPSFQPRSIFNPDGQRQAPPAGPVPAGPSETGAGPLPDLARRQHGVDQLVRNYRVRGHIIARTNPLGLVRPIPPDLDPAACGLDEQDLDRVFVVDRGDRKQAEPLRQIIARMQRTYCGPIGVQFMHIDDAAERRWLLVRMESSENRIELARAVQVRVLSRLIDAVVFEEFIHKKFVGAKSFSLEGAEMLIPLLDLAIEAAGRQGVDEIVLGMAHRGRLNVLANIIGKSPRAIFREFEDLDANLYMHGGDVKYHQGYSGDWTTLAGAKIHLSLCFNPSHIEFIDPVAVGRVRAKQDRAGDAKRTRKMCLLIHGDAGFAGEGIVQETLNLSNLAGYGIGGTIHVIVDNQIGFTTPPEQGRSSLYASDIARMLQSPIFHVNGEDPEAVAQAVQLAMDFRREFRRDVVIEMVCYRRYGHNESDEPRFTQPTLYQLIDRHESARKAPGESDGRAGPESGALARLLALGQLSAQEAENIAVERREHLERKLAEATSKDYAPWWANMETSIWRPYLGGLDKPAYDVDTAVAADQLAAMLGKLAQVPADFHPHRTIERFLAARREMADGNRPIDWSAAEALAFGTLATAGHRIRLTGQDTEHGTFSQRHAVLHDAQTGQTFTPLANLAAGQAAVEICNSPLSESAVLGFEYGYSIDCPEGLVLWEAQFGDFANAAQVIIDQFIASAQDKWCRLSGLVLLLPHGVEGMGPEHSSARLERFCTLAADDNIQVIYPTTPAQYFHVLRRQVLRQWRKPMVVLTPKSLLRHAQSVSTLAELSGGSFQRVIPDASTFSRETQASAGSAKVRRLILCTGKFYFDLDERRRKLGRTDVAIVRVEQLYPLPTETLTAAIGQYPDSLEIFWVQEEPANMGAWSFIWTQFGPNLLGRFPLKLTAPSAMTTPASGSAASHRLGQETLLNAAFEGL